MRSISSQHNVQRQIDRLDLLDLFGSKNILQRHLSKELLESQGITVYCKKFSEFKKKEKWLFSVNQCGFKCTRKYTIKQPLNFTLRHQTEIKSGNEVYDSCGTYDHLLSRIHKSFPGKKDKEKFVSDFIDAKRSFEPSKLLKYIPEAGRFLVLDMFEVCFLCFLPSAPLYREPAHLTKK